MSYGIYHNAVQECNDVRYECGLYDAALLAGNRTCTQLYWCKDTLQR